MPLRLKPMAKQPALGSLAATIDSVERKEHGRIVNRGGTRA
jgi:hypothetical protein